MHVALVALLEILWLAGISTSLQAETGSVAVVFTKGGFILGVGGGDGVLTFRGRHYRFTVSGMKSGCHDWRLDHQACWTSSQSEGPRVH